jgi:glycerophosphoryl diester phosphodiesterase
LLTHEPDLSPIWDIAQRLRARSIHPYWAFATEEVVRRAHGEGLEVIVWTVNEIEAMNALVARGVDGIISDHPERFALVEAGT